jgi:hypothetical protein
MQGFPKETSNGLERLEELVVYVFPKDFTEMEQLEAEISVASLLVGGIDLARQTG